MTMPHLMNCPHMEDGHCLACVKEAWEELDAAKNQLSNLKAELQNLLGGWRVAENCLSDADGDGPYRESLHEHAMQLEKLLKDQFPAEAPKVVEELPLRYTPPYCGGCGHRFFDEPSLPEAEASKRSISRRCSYCIEDARNP